MRAQYEYRTNVIDADRTEPREIERWLNDQGRDGYRYRDETLLPNGYTRLVVERPAPRQS
jgi:hypothetical protein